MTQTEARPARANDPEEQYQALLRSLRRRKGFGIVFVQCTPAQATRLTQRVQQDLPQKPSATLTLTEPIDNLYKLIAQRTDLDHLKILFIQGIEKLIATDIKQLDLHNVQAGVDRGYGGEGGYYALNTLPPILNHLNRQRENFRDHFLNLCLVFILPRFAIKYFIRRAPDFFDWGSSVFVFPTDTDLIETEYTRLLQTVHYNEYSQLTQEERDRTILELQSLIEDPNLPPENKAQLCYEQGKFFAVSGDATSAIASYDKAIELKPDYFEVWYRRGMLLFDLEHDEEAIASFDEAVEIKSDYSDVWYFRGIALSSLGRLEEAIVSYDKSVEFQENNFQAWYQKGNALRRLELYEEAIASYDKAIAVKGNYYEAWYNRGFALRRLGRYEEAIASFDKALELNPDSHNAWYNRAFALRRLGRYEEAIASFDKTLELNPDLYQAWYNKACYFALWGKVDEAITSLREAISFDERFLSMAESDPDFDCVRQNSDFKALLAGEKRLGNHL